MVASVSRLGATVDLRRWPPPLFCSSSPFFGRRCPRRARTSAAPCSARRMSFLLAPLHALGLVSFWCVVSLVCGFFPPPLASRRSPHGGGALHYPRPRVAGRTVIHPLGMPWGSVFSEFLPVLPRYAAGLWLAADRPRAFPCGPGHGQSVGLRESLQLRVHATRCPTP